MTVHNKPCMKSLNYNIFLKREFQLYLYTRIGCVYSKTDLITIFITALILCHIYMKRCSDEIWTVEILDSVQNAYFIQHATSGRVVYDSSGCCVDCRPDITTEGRIGRWCRRCTTTVELSTKISVLHRIRSEVVRV